MSKKKIEFASASRVEELRSEVDELLLQLAHLFVEPSESEEEWLNYVFVSDESSLAEFLSSDSELLELRRRLDLPELVMQDFICGVSLALVERKLSKLSTR